MRIKGHFPGGKAAELWNGPRRPHICVKNVHTSRYVLINLRFLETPHLTSFFWLL